MLLAHPHGEEAAHLATTNIVVAVALVVLILLGSAYIVTRQVRNARKESERVADELDRLEQTYPPHHRQ